MTYEERIFEVGREVLAKLKPKMMEDKNHSLFEFFGHHPYPTVNVAVFFQWDKENDMLFWIHDGLKIVVPPCP